MKLGGGSCIDMGRVAEITSPTCSFFGRSLQRSRLHRTKCRITLTDDRSRDVLFRLIDVCLKVIKVLAWICRLVLASFDEPEEARRKEGSQDGTEPIDPVLSGE